MPHHIVIRSVPFATRLRAAAGAREILQRDRARATKFLAGVSSHGPRPYVEEHKRSHHHKHKNAGAINDPSAPTTTVPAPTTGTSGSTGGAGDSIDVTDSGVTYTMSVGVGNPPTQYNLLIDTGSSNTWVGASTAYKPTSTSQATGNTINVSYGSGKMSGKEYTDTVTLSPSLVIKNQSIGVASTAQGFTDVDGILGVGPVDLTQGTVSNTTEVPTVTDNLYSQGTISSDSLGIFYEPSSSAGAVNGELTFGGTDNTKYTGEINFVPLTTTSPASNYWGIDQSVTYGSGATPILNTTAGIVDTGTTLLLLATDAFQAYQKATGGTLDQTTGLLTITEQQYEQLQSLYFSIGGVSCMTANVSPNDLTKPTFWKITYELTPNAQIWPIYLITSDLGSQSGSGLDFINGFGWLQRFYSVFDTGNAQVGLATTSYTDAETN
ncbi:acid protease [Melanogaster broomeanus]|nr:acid protease [Melanogaster broomeanus]